MPFVMMISRCKELEAHRETPFENHGRREEQTVQHLWQVCACVSQDRRSEGDLLPLWKLNHDSSQQKTSNSCGPCWRQYGPRSKQRLLLVRPMSDGSAYGESGNETIQHQCQQCGLTMSRKHVRLPPIVVHYGTTSWNELHGTIKQELEGHLRFQTTSRAIFRRVFGDHVS